MNDNYPIIVKTYQLTLWYMKKIEKLPRNHKFPNDETLQAMQEVEDALGTTMSLEEFLDESKVYAKTL